MHDHWLQAILANQQRGLQALTLSIVLAALARLFELALLVLIWRMYRRLEAVTNKLESSHGQTP